MKKLVGLVFFALGTAYASSVYAYEQCAEEEKMSTPDTGLSAIPASINFSNASTDAIRVYWLDFNGERVLYKTLDAANSYTQDTYLASPWVITDMDDNCKGIYFPDAQLRTIEIAN